jgi:hypothetical protein
MYLKYENDVVLLEFKRLRPGNLLDGRRWVDDGGAVDKTWAEKRATLAEERALVGECYLSPFFVETYKVDTFQKLEDGAQKQCEEYKKALSTKGLNVTMACTVIHWTYDDKCVSALLVKEVK